MPGHSLDSLSSSKEYPSLVSTPALLTKIRSLVVLFSISERVFSIRINTRLFGNWPTPNHMPKKQLHLGNTD